MPRRVSLPGADELFRSTDLARQEPEAAPAPPPAEVTSLPTAAERERARASRPTGPRVPSGRQRHDEKITVYVSPSELVDLEHARLMLRAEHGVAVDRGRIVREALAVVLADFEAKGEHSILVRRLGSR